MKRRILLLKLALKNIRLNWRHSLATMLAIMGGFSAVSLFDGFLQALTEYNAEHYVNKGMVGHVLIQKRGAKEHLFEDPWRYSINRDEQEKLSTWLRENHSVASAMRVLIVSGLISNGKNNAIFIGSGAEEDAGLKFRGEKWAWNTVAGKPMYVSPANSFLMGMGLARRMDCQFDASEWLKPDGSYMDKERPMKCSSGTFQLSATTEHAQVNATNLVVSGVVDFQLREFNEKIAILPLRAAQDLLDTDQITRVAVLLNNPAESPAFVRDATSYINRSGLDLEAIEWMNHPVAAASKGGMEILGIFRGLFLSIVSVIAAMSVANSMMKSINERIREIGMLRSFGFYRRDIMLLFSFEGLLLGFFSCALGIVVSSGLSLLIRNLGLKFKAGVLSTPMPVRISMAFDVWIITALVLSLITFVASLIVSRKAARMVVADALRYTA